MANKMSSRLFLIALCGIAVQAQPGPCFDPTQAPLCPNGTTAAGYLVQGYQLRDGRITEVCSEMNGRSMEDMANDRDYQDTFLRVGVPIAGGTYCCKTTCPHGTKILGPYTDFTTPTSSGMVQACPPDSVFADGFCCQVTACTLSGPMSCKCPSCDNGPRPF